MKERTRYQASWGAWYVQVTMDDGQDVELKFDHEPTWAEVEPVAQSVWASMQPPPPPVPTIGVITEEGVTV